MRLAQVQEEEGQDGAVDEDTVVASTGIQKTEDGWRVPREAMTDPQQAIDALVETYGASWYYAQVQWFLACPLGQL